MKMTLWTRFSRLPLSFLVLTTLSIGCAHEAPKPEPTPTPAAAAAPARPSWLVAHPYFATEDFAVYAPSFHAFPPKGSDAESEDFKALLAWQNKRTAAQCAEADTEGKADPVSFMRGLHFKVSEADQQKLLPFLEKVKADSDFVIHHYKDEFGRDRPPLVNPELHPCIELPTTKSYPSGHAAIGVVLAAALKEIYPTEWKELSRRGDEFGEHRVLGGVHYPSDIAMGRILGKKVYEEEKKSPEFQKELRDLKKAFKGSKVTKSARKKKVAA